LIDKIMGGNPVFRGTRVPVHMLAELVPSRVRGAHALPEGKCDQLPHLDPPCSPTNTRTADQLYKSTPGGFEHIACRFRSAR